MPGLLERGPSPRGGRLLATSCRTEWRGGGGGGRGARQGRARRGFVVQQQHRYPPERRVSGLCFGGSDDRLGDEVCGKMVLWWNVHMIVQLHREVFAYEQCRDFYVVAPSRRLSEKHRPRSWLRHLYHHTVHDRRCMPKQTSACIGFPPPPLLFNLRRPSEACVPTRLWVPRPPQPPPRPIALSSDQTRAPGLCAFFFFIVNFFLPTTELVLITRFSK